MIGNAKAQVNREPSRLHPGQFGRRRCYFCPAGSGSGLGPGSDGAAGPAAACWFQTWLSGELASAPGRRLPPERRRIGMVFQDGGPLLVREGGPPRAECGLVRWSLLTARLMPREHRG